MSDRSLLPPCFRYLPYRNSGRDIRSWQLIFHWIHQGAGLSGELADGTSFGNLRDYKGVEVFFWPWNHPSMVHSVRRDGGKKFHQAIVGPSGFQAGLAQSGGRCHRASDSSRTRSRWICPPGCALAEILSSVCRPTAGGCPESWRPGLTWPIWPASADCEIYLCSSYIYLQFVCQECVGLR